MVHVAMGPASGGAGRPYAAQPRNDGRSRHAASNMIWTSCQLARVRSQRSVGDKIPLSHIDIDPGQNLDRNLAFAMQYLSGA
jgi:hypothetical protein